GVSEISVDPGVAEMVRALADAPCRLYVATSKVEAYAEGILQHFALVGYFVAIHGSEPDGRLDDKALLVGELIDHHGLDRRSTVMVGDRHHDIAAARRNGIGAIGVTYGYGSHAELIGAGAGRLSESPPQGPARPPR